MKKYLNPLEVTPYNFYLDLFPPRIDKHFRDSLFILNDALHTEKPSFIESLAIHSQYWYYRPKSVDVFVFGNFRNRYKALVQTAEFLAEFYLQHDYLPLIQPLTHKDWEYQVETDGRYFHTLRKSGLVVYSTEGR